MKIGSIVEVTNIPNFTLWERKALGGKRGEIISMDERYARVKFPDETTHPALPKSILFRFDEITLVEGY